MSICIIVAMQLKTNILKKRNSRAGKEITGQVNTKKKISILLTLYQGNYEKRECVCVCMSCVRANMILIVVFLTHC